MANLEFNFTVAPDGAEPFEVTAKSRDLAHWERQFKGVSIDRLANNPTVNDLESLAWVTSSRRGVFQGNLNEFREQCDFDMLDADEDEDDGAGPTQQGR